MDTMVTFTARRLSVSIHIFIGTNH
jgi:hypothetical protein